MTDAERAQEYETRIRQTLYEMNLDWGRGMFDRTKYVHILEGERNKEN